MLDDQTGIFVRERRAGAFRRLWPLTATGTAAVAVILAAAIVLLTLLS